MTHDESRRPFYPVFLLAIAETFSANTTLSCPDIHNWQRLQVQTQDFEVLDRSQHFVGRPSTKMRIQIVHDLYEVFSQDLVRKLFPGQQLPNQAYVIRHPDVIDIQENTVTLGKKEKKPQSTNFVGHRTREYTPYQMCGLFYPGKKANEVKVCILYAENPKWRPKQ